MMLECYGVGFLAKLTLALIDDYIGFRRVADCFVASCATGGKLVG
jgi:hypothetical protein